jgi:hypothetical protein
LKLPEHKNFFTVHGKSVGTLSDLKRSIEEMTDNEFKHHVNSHRNDFATWIRDILHKDYLADRLSKVSLKTDVLELIDDELTNQREVNPDMAKGIKRLVAKSFMYGLLIGLVIGIIFFKLI